MRHPIARSALLGVSAVASLLVLCAPGPDVSGNTSVPCKPLAQHVATRPEGWAGTVFTIVMENESGNDILGNPDAPYINRLASMGAVAAGYHDCYVHPSEPNYIWMVAGENFGVLDDDDPASHSIGSQSHLVDQIEREGLTWMTYQESMGQPCGLQTQGRYAPKHNPFVYFSDVNGWNGTQFLPSARCQNHVVDYSRWASDVSTGSIADYVFITPNLDDDMHDGPIAAGDAWLSREVPNILATDAFQRGGILFLLWDEGENATDNPPFIAVSPNIAAGTISHTDYDTSSFLLTVQKILGVEPLPCAADADAVKPMSDLFKIPL